MDSKQFKTLMKKVENLGGELIETKKENARLSRILLAAEAKLKKLTSIKQSKTNGVGIMDLTKQVEKMKAERKLIKTKVEKMASKLEQFYGN